MGVLTACSIQAAPANDNFASFSPIFNTNFNVTINGNNQTATKELGEPNHAGNSGGHSVWWHWTAPVNTTVMVDTTNANFGPTNFDTLLAVYTGTVVSNLTTIASDDDSGGNKTSLLTFTAVVGTIYHIAVDGWGGASGDFPLHLHVAVAAPQITSQPLSQALPSGTNASFSVSATGSTPLSYRWRKNGININNATNTTFVLTNVQVSDSAAYSVLVTNAAGVATSSNAILTVLAVPPTNDNFANRTVLTGTNIIVSGSTIAATKEVAETNHLGFPGSNSVWWSWTATNNCAVYVEIAGNQYPAIYTGNSLTNLIPVPSAAFVATAGTQYQIAVDGSQGVFTLRLRTAGLAVNDAFANHTTISGTSNSVTGSNFNATKEAGEPNHAGDPGGKSVWWTWTAPADGTAVLTDMGSSFAMMLAVYVGNSVSTLTNVISGFGFEGPLRFRVAAGTIYQIAADGASGEAGFIAFQLDLVPFPANDAFANRILITGLSNSVTGYNIGATKEPGEPSPDPFALGRTVWWTWTAPQDAQMMLTDYNDFAALLAVYTGSSVSQLAPVPMGQYGFAAIAGVSYQIAVDGRTNGYPADSGTIVLSLSPYPAPANDAFANRTSVSGTSVDAYGNNFDATREPGEPNHAGGAGGRSVWWTWTAPGNATVTVDTFAYSSPLATALAVYTGNSVSNLMLVAEGQGLLTFSSVAGTAYQIAVDGWGPVSGSFDLQLRAANHPSNDAFSNRLTITGPTNTVLGNNTGATSEPGEPYHANHAGGKSLWWTWASPTNTTVTVDTAGSAIPTALAVYTGNSVSTLAEVTSGNGNEPGQLTFLAQAGTNYQIAVDSWDATDGAIVLNVRSVSGPPNDSFSNRLPITGLVNTVTGSNVFATKEAGEPNHAGNSGGKSVWWTWTAPANVIATLDTIGSSCDTLLAVYAGLSVSNLTLVASDDQSGGNDAGALTFAATAGVSYAIAVDGFLGDFGSIQLNLTAGQVPGNDAFANRATIIGTNSVTGSNVNATKETGEPDFAEPPHYPFYSATLRGGKSVWWTWTAPSNGLVKLDSIGSSFDTLLTVYTGNSLASLTQVASDDDSGGNGTSALLFTARAGTAYQFSVSGFSGASGSILLNIQQLPAPSNDDFANRAVISGLSNTVTGSNVYATTEPGETQYFEGKTIWWTWTAPTNLTVTLDASGSSPYQSPRVYTGNSISNLLPVNLNFGGGPSVSFDAVAGRAYQIAVDVAVPYYLAVDGGDVVLTLTATPGPPNAAFDNRILLTGATNSAVGSNIGAVGGIGGLDNTVWWKWIAPASGPVLLDTVGSSFATSIGVFTGTSVGSLTIVSQANANRLMFAASAGTEYEIAVGGYLGASGNIVLHLQLLPAPPNDFFTNRLVILGSTNSVSGGNMFATKEAGEPSHPIYPGGESVWWTWTAPANGTALLDFGNSFYPVVAVYTGTSLSNLTLVANTPAESTTRLTFPCMQGTNYSFSVDDHYPGNPGGGYIAINLQLVPPTPNDAFAARIPITGLSNSVSGYNLGATAEAGEPGHAGYAARESVWWTWTAPTNLQVTLDTSGSQPWTSLAVYTGSAVANLTVVASNTFGAASFHAVSGVAYAIAVDSPSGDGGTIILNLQTTPLPANDNFANRITISGVSNSISGSNVGATKESGEPNHAGLPGGQSVWWTWTAPTNGTVEMDTFGSSFSALLGVYTGNSVSNLSLIAASSGTTGVTFAASSSTSYQIAVDTTQAVGGIMLNFKYVQLVATPPVGIAFKGGWPGFRSGPVIDVQVAGNLAYLVLGGGGMPILDVSEPANPRHIGEVGVSGVSRVAVEGRYAYLAGEQGLQVVDIINPAQPSVVGEYQDVALSRLAVHSNYVYALSADYPRSLLVFNATNQMQPLPIATNLATSAKAMAFQSGHVYLCDEHRFWIIDVSNPANPTPEGSLNLFDGIVIAAIDLAVDGGYVYLSFNSDLYIIDVRNPNSPSVVSQIRYVSYGSVDSPPCIGVSGTNAYIGSSTFLSVIDVSKPASPRLRTIFSPRISSEFLYIYGTAVAAICPFADRVYLAVNYDGLQVLNVATPSQPVGEGIYYTSTDLRQVSFSNNRVYAMNVPVGLQALDTSSPDQPELLGTFPYPFAFNGYGAVDPDFDVRGDFVYISDVSNGVSVVDFTVPSQPMLTARLLTNEHLTSLVFALSNNVAWAWSSQQIGVGPGAFSTNILYQFALSNNPATPILLTATSFTGAPQTNDGAVGWRNYFVSTDTTGLHVIDAANFWAPVEVGYYPGSDFAAVTLAGSQAIVAQGKQGITILDLGPAFDSKPNIRFQPQSLRRLPGTSARFEVGASGNIPLSCQWQFNGANIPGATNFLFTIANVQTTNAGLYSVAINNSIGSTNSANAELSVDSLPVVAITNPASGAIYREFATIALQVNAYDEGTVTQVAFFNGTTFLGTATNAPFGVVWSNVTAGSYVVTAVATDNEGATNVSAPVSILVTNQGVFYLSEASYTAYESNNAANIVVRRDSPTNASSVYLATFNVTARAVTNGVIGNYYAYSNRVDFAPGQTEQLVQIQLVNDLTFRGIKIFRVELSSTSNGWFLAEPAIAMVNIVDDDAQDTTNSFRDVVSAPPSPVARGSLTITLNPPAAAGRWRFPWETAWRPGGSTATNLVPDNYPVIFLERSGWQTPEPATNVVSGGFNESATNTYLFAGGAASGALVVTLHPAAVTNGQWRPVENPSQPWQNSGMAISNVPPGPLAVEFNPVSDYITPASTNIMIFAGQTATYDATYLLAGTAGPGEAPRPLANLNAIINTNGPYQFNGQLRTEAGTASGFVVKERVVLTAAHALFSGLSFTTNVWWFFQQETGELEPAPRIPRGSRVLAGYAAARTNDFLSGNIGPDQSSIAARQLDVAALYFFGSAGRGGYGGYLTTQPGGTDWLLTGSLMALTGYPMETVPLEDRSRMHQVGPGYYFFENIQGTSLYRTTDLKSFQGNSGGPLYVQSLDTLGRTFFLPAGVYLGGSGESIVHAIDLDVVDIISQAELASHGGGNSGGGVITIIPDQPGQGGSLPYIHVNLTGPAGAGWKLQGDSDFTNPPPNYYRGIISGASSVFISFRTVLGWDAPPSTNVIVKSNSTTVVNASYLLPPNLVLAAQPSYSSIGLAGGPFSPLGVCTLNNSGQQNLNWRAEKTASWLSLSALSGTIAPGQGISINLSVDASANSLAAGTYSDEVHFYNNSTSLGDTKQSVNLTVVTIKLGGFRFLNRSNIIMTLEGLPGKTYSIQRAVNVSQFTSNWTDLMFITNTTGAVTFTTAYPTNFPKAFYRARQL